MIVYCVQHTTSAPIYSFIYPHVISILDMKKPKLREDFFQLLGVCYIWVPHWPMGQELGLILPCAQTALPLDETLSQGWFLSCPEI